MSYASDDPATRLAAVRQAISDVLSSQSYSVGGRSNRRAELQYLFQVEQDLMKQIALNEAGSYGFSVVEIERPS